MLFLFMPLFAETQEPEEGVREDSSSLDIVLSAALTANLQRVYDEAGPALLFDSDVFSMIWDFSFKNDGKYTPPEPYLLGHYFSLNNGGLFFDFDYVELSGGRLTHSDIVESPYSLFISSMGIPSLLIDVSLDFDFFFYTTRWIRLNTRSAYGYPERGMNYKVYGISIDGIRFGLQDSVVYVGRSFDVEYFLNPLPQYFVQLATTTAGKPWTEEGNTNSINGVFFDMTRQNFYLYAQFLIDDFNLGFLVPGKEITIPNKIAWSLGGRYNFSFGSLGFYHAGATKYTFAATYSNPDGSSVLPYEYAYYPSSVFLKDGSISPILYRDNYIGYKYGENGLAFQIDYSNTFWGVNFFASLEYAVSGSKSPSNPWHQYLHYYDGPLYTRLFDYPYAEHRLTLDVEFFWPLSPFSFWSRLQFGGVFNKLALVDSADGGAQYYQPQAGVNEAVFSLTIGLQYLIDIQ